MSKRVHVRAILAFTCARDPHYGPQRATHQAQDTRDGLDGVRFTWRCALPTFMMVKEGSTGLHLRSRR